MDPINILNEIRQKLQDLSKNPRNIKDYSRFHKSNKACIKLSTPIVRCLSSIKFKKVKHLNKNQIFELCERLLECNDSSCRTIAFDWAFRIKKEYQKKDFIILEKWLDKYVHGWGSCDDFCTHAFGYFLFVYPKYIPKVYNWTKSKNIWKRRAAAVIFIYSTRKDKYLDDILNIAKLLLLDKEDLVQKAYGWMLKEASKHKQKEVFDFVIKYKNTMPKTALRYAIEKMPESLRRQAMKIN